MDFYLITKAVHIIAVISWMAGMLYLPRLFVYHVKLVDNEEASETFKIMERRLLKAIMTPAFGLALLSGSVASVLFRKCRLAILLAVWQADFAGWIGGYTFLPKFLSGGLFKRPEPP